MNFLAPAAFLLAALLPLIVLLYLLKLRRTEREVSSVYLWRRMVRDVEANAPWQRLRRNLLLVLQLLFLAALIFALARPFTWAEGSGGQAAILILDTSASMAATDVAPTRLEAAKSQATRLVDDLPEGARVTIIAAGSRAQVLAASTQDVRQAHLALESIQAESGGSDLTTALELASAIAARQPDTEIIVLSDGRVELPERLALRGHLRYLPLGLSGENQAVNLLTLEPSADGSRLTAFVQVVNYGAEPAQRRLQLFALGGEAGGALLNAYDLDLPAGGQQAVLAEDLPLEIEGIEARLKAGNADILPTDDSAVAVRQSGEPVAVNLVTEGNLFLQTALTLLPNIEVTAFTPDESAALPAAGLTVIEGALPLTGTLPAGNLLFIAPTATTEYFTVTGTLENPTPRPVDASDPLIRHVSLSGVSLLDAARIPLPLWARPVIAGDVAEGSGSPLLFAGETDGRRIAVLAFDLRRSDLPLQVAFPILWSNLIGWLAPGAAGGLPPQVAPGETLALSLPPEVQRLSVTLPDGSVTTVQPEAGQALFAATGQLGIYTLRWETGAGPAQAAFAVNLFSPQESDLDPADSLPLAGAAGADAAANELQARREWWRPLALLALALLTVEWLVYHRAALARLRAAFRRRLPSAAGASRRE